MVFTTQTGGTDCYAGDGVVLNLLMLLGGLCNDLKLCCNI